MVWIRDVKVLHVELECKANLLAIELIPDWFVKVKAESIVILLMLELKEVNRLARG